MGGLRRKHQPQSADLASSLRVDNVGGGGGKSRQ